MRRFLLLALVALSSATAYYVLGDRGVPSPQTVKEIEALVVMPAEAHPLTEYARYYSYGWKGWTPVVVGVFLWSVPGTNAFGPRDATMVSGVAGAYAVREAPKVYDGGCFVVTVYYDVSAKQLLPTERDGKQQLAVCNGQ